MLQGDGLLRVHVFAAQTENKAHQDSPLQANEKITESPSPRITAAPNGFFPKRAIKAKRLHLSGRQHRAQISRKRRCVDVTHAGVTSSQVDSLQKPTRHKTLKSIFPFCHLFTSSTYTSSIYIPPLSRSAGNGKTRHGDFPKSVGVNRGSARNSQCGCQSH